jgi:hypothetical protein
MPTSRRRLAIVFALFASITVVACGASVVERSVEDDTSTTTGGTVGGGGQGGQGAGGQGGADPECPEPPPFCIVAWTIDDNGCMVCDPISCSDCGPEQLCSTCNYANGVTHGCHDVPVPEPGEFVCKWTTCATGALCLDTQPAGDGCEEAKCADLPAECAGDPTCACIAPLFNTSGCTEDADGNITLTGFFL